MLVTNPASSAFSKPIPLTPHKLKTAVRQSFQPVKILLLAFFAPAVFMVGAGDV
jgi:hypothetical protein